MYISFGAFGENLKTQMQKDHLQPLFVLYGNDSFEAIGDPKVIGGSKDLITLWEDSFYSIYPKNNDYNKNEENQFDENEYKSIYKEQRIDSELINFEYIFTIINLIGNETTAIQF